MVVCGVTRRLNSLSDQPFDVLMIGGGIVGACAARDAARRGLTVALIDRGDFGSGIPGTASRSCTAGFDRSSRSTSPGARSSCASGARGSPSRRISSSLSRSWCRRAAPAANRRCSCARGSRSTTRLARSQRGSVGVAPAAAMATRFPARSFDRSCPAHSVSIPAERSSTTHNSTRPSASCDRCSTMQCARVQRSRAT